MKVKIKEYKRSAMQSAPKQDGLWELTFIEDKNTRFVSDKTGWTSSADTKTQLKLKFNSKDDAIKYAKQKNLEYIIIFANKSSIKPKSYSDNFL